MQFSILIAALSVIYGVEATSTVTCNGCPEPTSVQDIVTREPVPTVSCSSPPLLVVVNGTTSTPITSPTGTGGLPSSSGSPVPTDAPVSGGSKVLGSLSGAAAVAVAIVYLA